MKPHYMSEILKGNAPSMVNDYMQKHNSLQPFMKKKIQEAYATALNEARMLMVVCEKETEDKLKETKVE